MLACWQKEASRTCKVTKSSRTWLLLITSHVHHDHPDLTPAPVFWILLKSLFNWSSCFTPEHQSSVSKMAAKQCIHSFKTKGSPGHSLVHTTQRRAWSAYSSLQGPLWAGPHWLLFFSSTTLSLFTLLELHCCPAIPQTRHASDSGSWHSLLFLSGMFFPFNPHPVPEVLTDNLIFPSSSFIFLSNTSHSHELYNLLIWLIGQMHIEAWQAAGTL